MDSSGIKRGLAAFAVSALAVSGIGIAAGSAYASPNDLTGAADVSLLTQVGGGASIANDGTNTTVTLLAVGSGDVKKVRFSYSAAGGADQEIAVVERVNGAFTAQFTPPANVLGGVVDLKVTGLDALGTPIAGAADVNAGVSVSGAAKAVAITTAPGAPLGAYTLPGDDTFVAVNGSTDAAALTGLSDIILGTPNPAGIRSFSGVQNLGTYTWETGPTARNEAVLQVETPGSDDAVAVKLYEQVISAFTATPAKTSVPTTGVTTTEVTVAVKDQNGKPVAGAVVVGPASTATTNAAGEAVFTAVGAGTPSYFVDVNNDGAYDNGLDFKKTVTIGSYSPTLAALEVKTAKPAYDRDELVASTVTVGAKDQNGAAYSALGNLKGTWTLTPFGAGAPTTGALSINGAGEIAVPAGEGTFAFSVWDETDGTPGKGAGEVAAPAFSVKVGEAALAWDASNGNVQTSAGTDVSVNGKLALADGTALPGRSVDLALSTGGDARFAAQGAQPAGVTVISPTAATATTAANGAFTVKVSDPAAVPPAVQAKELNVNVAASSVITTAIAHLDIDFQKVAVETIAVSDSAVFGGVPTPGRPTQITGTVENADGDVLSNTAVQLQVDKGFFVQTDATLAGDPDFEGLVPETGPTDGALWGDWKSAGTTITVVTDANGDFEAVVGIERHADFDDDGDATINVTAVAGGKTQVTPVDFTSNGAVNISEVKLSYAVDQDSRVLPKAESNLNVNVDVAALDQFGNRTTAAVDLANTGAGSVPAWVWSNYTDDTDGAISLSLTGAAGLQTVKGKNTDAKRVWKNTAIAPAPAAWDEVASPNTVQSAGLDVEWYEADYEAGSYTLTHNGTAWNAVGKIVKATFEAKDQNGQPIDNMDVDFFRAGPDDLQDGGGVSWTSTNADGKVSYTFQGAKAGTAVVSTVAQVGGTEVEAAVKTVEIKFGTEPVDPGTPVAPKTVKAKLSGASNGKKADKLALATTPAAPGAVAKLQARNAKGKWVTVATKKVSSSGKVTFSVKDKNGAKKTSYRVTVAKTATTKAAVSNTRAVR